MLSPEPAAEPASAACAAMPDETLSVSNSGAAHAVAAPEDSDSGDEFFDFDNVESSQTYPAVDGDEADLVPEIPKKLTAKAGKHIILHRKVPIGRSSLPMPMSSRGELSIFGLLKQCIGKELSKITMPVQVNEPISFLQRLAEYMEYAHLLEKANVCSDPVERMQYVAAFAVSSCSSNYDRISKPFNPLLGETYELDRPELGYKIMCEQVSHHPPISAFNATSPGYRFYGAVCPKLAFWGKSVEISVKGLNTVELLGHGETYTWENTNCTVHNVIIGKLWVEHHGIMKVVNHSAGLQAELNFKKCTLLSREAHKVEGYIVDSRKVKVKFIYGSWTDALFAADTGAVENMLKQKGQSSHGASNSLLTVSTVAVPKSTANGDGAEDNEHESPVSQLPRNSSSFDLHIPGQALLWQADSRPDNAAQFYNFTRFAILLNELTDKMRPQLPPTDSRLRPDIRDLENGLPDAAAAQKEALEEKQRKTRHTMKKDKEEWRPRWYKQGVHPITGKESWLFTGCYWNRDWKECPDIF